MKRTVTFLAPILAISLAGAATSQVSPEPMAEPVQQPTALCLPAIMDQQFPAGPCIKAATYPYLGMLYPLSVDLYVDRDAFPGYVGIGTIQPQKKLHVRGSVGAESLIALDGRAAFPGIDELFYIGTQWDNGTGIQYAYLGSDSDLYTLNVTNDGNVGIGFAQPETKLHVQGKIGAENLIALDGKMAQPLGAINELFYIGTQWVTDEGSTDYLYIGSQGDASSLYTLNVTGAGNVGIGTALPSHRLQVDSAGIGVMFRSDTDKDRISFDTSDNNGGVINLFDQVGSTIAVRISAYSPAPSYFDAGNVGIGTQTPSEKLHVVGNVRIDGDICSTSGLISSCSDARFKKNVETIRDPLKRVTELCGVEFDWRRDEFPDRQFSDEHQVGLLAQEVQQVLPEVVTENQDGIYSVDYSRIVPVLIEAIKEQQTQIDALRGELAALREGG